jgi:hypothetical protein
MRNDPTGLWADVIWQFPGRGSDYALPAGREALIAVSAADHRAVHGSFLDLSTADFEFLLSAGADNPGVPNMVSVGTRPHLPRDFRGNALWFLADPQHVTTYTPVFNPGASAHNNDYYVHIPAATILDVAYLWWDVTGSYIGTVPLPFCLHPVAPVFDRIPGGFQQENESELYRSY